MTARLRKCSHGKEPNDLNVSGPSETVTASVIFRAFSNADQQPLSGVNLVIIDQSGRVAGQLVPDDDG